MEVPGGGDRGGGGGDGAEPGVPPDPRAPGAAAPGSGPCAAARESERQLRLRLCVLNEILGTERDYVGTLRFLQSVSVSPGSAGAAGRGASARGGPPNLWPPIPGVARVAAGAPRGARRGARSPGLPPELVWVAFLAGPRGPAPSRGLPHFGSPRARRLPFCLFPSLPSAPLE